MARDFVYWRLRPQAPAKGTLLCAASEIAEGKAKEFSFGFGRNAFLMFVVRHRRRLCGYLNLCPHFSLPLNHEADKFLTDDHIVCVRHFARFRPEDGFCVQGACEGEHLVPVPIIVDDDGMIRIGGVE